MTELSELAATGIDGLDHVLRGGLPRDRIYLVEGDPGVGKTTLALQFLLAGVAAGERALYVTLSETEQEVRQIADSHGWSLDGLAMFELSALEQQRRLESQNTIFHPSDVELTETTRAIFEHVERVSPHRVVFDSLSELRLLAQHALRYRREVLGFKQHFTGKRATVLLLDDRTSEPGDMQLQSLAHGVLSLQQMAPEYGNDRRRLRVNKLRGATYVGGNHDYAIRRGGIELYPRLVAAEHHDDFTRESISSDVASLDRMLGGGLTRGSSTLLVGPAGSGKSSIAALYATAAARRGQRCAIFAFDELRRTLIERGDALRMEMSTHIANGSVLVQQIDPGEMSPGELTARVTRLVDEGISFLVIDSLNGYLHAMPAEKYLYIQLHELLTYLAQRGVTTLLVLAQAGLVDSMTAPADVSYIADGVILFRYFEAHGRLHKAISVVKKRTGAHEDSIRELSFAGGVISVGEPLAGFRGVLQGVPETLAGPA